MGKTGFFLLTFITVILLGSCSDDAMAAKLGFSRAYCLGNTISPREAVSACTAVLQKFHNNFNVLIRRGVAFAELGEFDYAVGDFSRAIKLDQNNAIALQLRGLAYEMQGRLQESMADYMRVVEINPFDQELRAAILRVTAAISALSVVKQAPTPNEPITANIEQVPKMFVQSRNPARASDGDEWLLIVPSLLVLASLALSSLLTPPSRGTPRAA